MTVRPSGTPVFVALGVGAFLAILGQHAVDVSRTWFSCSVPAASFSTSGCSGAITKYVAPNSVSGRVVKTE